MHVGRWLEPRGPWPRSWTHAPPHPPVPASCRRPGAQPGGQPRGAAPGAARQHSIHLLARGAARPQKPAHSHRREVRRLAAWRGYAHLGKVVAGSPGDRAVLCPQQLAAHLLPGQRLLTAAPAATLLSSHRLSPCAAARSCCEPQVNPPCPLSSPIPPGLSTWRWSTMRRRLGTWRSRGRRFAASPTSRVSRGALAAFSLQFPPLGRGDHAHLC